ncbi:rRNA methyltransferase 3, mitochondrial-like [Argiope bruennichi]|uniref:rRNA methyltransferase 3, mitochondrial-like n=1 Tax=Argiope bruennichi TaxID=94029 RepID=UPI002494B721|nr:rRNA methyltransferase 3, mitochondrial-like [Argiope bruennichi]
MSVSMSIAFKNLSSLTRNSCRLYSKNVLRRRPVRVLNVPSDETLQPVQSENFASKFQLTRENVKDVVVEFPKDQESGLIVPPYEKLQKNDPRFTKTLTMLKNRKLREKKEKILIEGKRLINDAIDAGMVLETLYFSREKELPEIKFKFQENVEIFKVFYKTLQLWSNLTTCPGIMGVFKKPTTETLHILSEPAIPVTLICDNIRDPGNLGSIIRNAAAAGCQNILLTKGCVDPWEHKVLRAGCGGHFRIPIINNIEWTQISNYIPKKSTVFIADNSADIVESSITPEFINYDEVPDEEVNKNGEVEIKKYVTTNECNQPVTIDETYNEPTELEKFEEIDLPCHLYSGIKFPKENIVLYVGGETHGVDARAVKLACDYGGKKVKIPLENSMESLNSSFAVTIILYEIKRQLTETYVLK